MNVSNRMLKQVKMDTLKPFKITHYIAKLFTFIALPRV